jgi:hypothetical protein
MNCPHPLIGKTVITQLRRMFAEREELLAQCVQKVREWESQAEANAYKYDLPYKRPTDEQIIGMAEREMRWILKHGGEL